MNWHFLAYGVGRGGGVGKGLSKLKISVDYFVIYDLWKIIVYCRSPKFLIFIVSGAKFTFCPNLEDLMPGTEVSLVLTVQHGHCHFKNCNHLQVCLPSFYFSMPILL
jgi:hypothetical protein